MSALTVTFGADITALKRVMAGATGLVGASARRMSKMIDKAMTDFLNRVSFPESFSRCELTRATGATSPCRPPFTPISPLAG
jgi:hypothetical protein